MIYNVIKGVINMKEKFVLELNSEMFYQCKELAEDIGLSMEGVFNMFLKKLLNEGDWSFLFKSPKINHEKKIIANEVAICNNNEVITCNNDNVTMTKSKAIRLLKSKNIDVKHVVTYASKNKSSDFYWANPNFEVLDDNWTLILNDWIDRKLIVFNIPLHSIRPEQFKARADKEQLIDLQISYKDSTYTDSRSEFSFLKYFVDIITY